MRPSPLSVACAVLLLGTSSLAQTVYRSTGPDGRVTFSDKPPVAAEHAKTLTPRPGQISPGAGTRTETGAGSTVARTNGNANLPYALRQTMAKYPVTLYTTAQCSPCQSARQLLQARGIPVRERTVQTAEDAAALRALGPANAMPYLTVGTQGLHGFSPDEWHQVLDAAGYPRSSLLPASYRQAAASPLAPPPPAAPASAAESAPEPTPLAPPSPRAPSGPNPGNPAGIAF